MKVIAVLMTCHNRRDKTLECLATLFKNGDVPNIALDVYLVDDGSTDGTSMAVSSLYPNVKLIYGDGSLYWNGGMRIAFASAMAKGFDFYLWLNDDTFLFDDAVLNMLRTYEKVSEHGETNSIVVGSTRDIFTGHLTYGGEVRSSSWKPLAFKHVQPTTNPIRCITMNGNFVLIPKAAVAILGNLEQSFSHAMGDTDYGLRANAANIPLWVTPGFVGTCGHNSKSNTYLDKSLSLRTRFRKIFDVKGLPVAPWYVFTKRHGGFLWPLYFVWPYIKVIGRTGCSR